ncbi:MAG: hypothetical protein GKR93_10100 [Gammaproteobacteria bacterium]|nr:hypothetical protein [Gammaproteobacteria bacterium]
MCRYFNKLFSFFSVFLLLNIFSSASAEEGMPYPIIKAEYIVVERMLVKPGQEAWFEKYWSSTLLPVFEKIDGFMGAYMLANTAPTGSPEGETNFGPLLPLGPRQNFSTTRWYSFEQCKNRHPD